MYLMLTYLLTPDLRVASTTPTSQNVDLVDIDVVGVAIKATCVTQRAVIALNEYFGPRRIIVVTVSEIACQKFRSFATNVDCRLEMGLLPGVSKTTIGSFLERHYGQDGHEYFVGREVSGWYLQQFLKLGAMLYIKDLSQYFVVWDLDMILLKDLEIFHESEFGRQTIIHIGGNNDVGYDYSYKNLTGREIEKARDGTSFVTHSMVVYQPYMQEYLAFLSDRSIASGAPKGCPWVWAILSGLDPNDIHLGYSEYASYASWTIQHHPNSVYVMPKKTWSRHPIGGTTSLALSKLFGKNRLCCPSDAMLLSMRTLGYQYTGFEIGHNDRCNYNDPKYKDGYGV